MDDQLDYWKIIAEMRPGLVENSLQITFRAGAHYGGPAFECPEHRERLFSQALQDGLIVGREVPVLGGPINVTVYELTPEGVDKHKQLVAIDKLNQWGSGLEYMVLPNP
ncbi:MAG: hypothetical protein QF535_09375 [Anaerolineales bacterium]|jgi:hypothetical protein|nr:hypothetical protein [Anaerolineales bacterium]|tara:strand:+ start:1165 stop:1491 length:327 start_codon:yes stop_codon:yes gene_type:complete